MKNETFHDVTVVEVNNQYDVEWYDLGKGNHPRFVPLHSSARQGTKVGDIGTMEYQLIKEPIRNQKWVFTKQEFKNENRTRYYGLQVGDLVKHRQMPGIQEIRALDGSDNNCVFISPYPNDGKVYPQFWIPVVAEWCTILTKAEERIPCEEV